MPEGRAGAWVEVGEPADLHGQVELLARADRVAGGQPYGEGLRCSASSRRPGKFAGGQQLRAEAVDAAGGDGQAPLRRGRGPGGAQVLWPDADGERLAAAGVAAERAGGD